MTAEEAKLKKMTETPIPRLITVLAIPTILSMLVTSLYNMADTYFVGLIGGTEAEQNAATGAISVVFSLMAVIQACGFFFGQGSGNFMSRALGNKDVEGAERMAVFGFVSALLCGAIIAVLGLVLLEPLAYALGSTETILPYAKDYMFFILLGAPFMCGSFVLNNQMRFQGNAYISMIGIISGAVINVGLDALFIIVLNMGTAGAGLATAIGQVCSFIILFVGMKLGNNVKLKIKNYRITAENIKEVFRGGTPALARQGLSSVSTLSLNFAAKAVGGDPIIAAMGVVARVMSFCFSVSLGFGQGFQPVCGFNYGAKKYARVKEGYFFCIKVSVVFSLVVGGLIFAFAPAVIGLFNNSLDVVNAGKTALRAQCLSFQLVGMLTFTNMMLQTVGKVVPATVLSLSRHGIFYLPFVFLLPFAFNYWGLILVQPLADLLSFALAVVLARRELRRLTALEKAELNNGEI